MAGSQETSAAPRAPAWAGKAWEVVPAVILLLLNLVLGGATDRGVMSGQLLSGVAVVALVLLAMVRPPITLRGFSWILLAAFLILVIQLIPLPPPLWQALPGRSFFAEGYNLLGFSTPWLPISLDPGATAESLPFLGMAVALFAACRISLERQLWLAVAVLAVAMISVFLGIAQALGGLDSNLYFYSSTNRGSAVGFFANSNHLGTLFGITVIIAGAVAAELSGRTPRMTPLVWTCLGAIALLCGAAVALTHSLAGVLLFFLGSLVAVGLQKGPQRRPIMIGIVCIAIGVAVLGAASGRGLEKFSTSIGDEQYSRLGIGKRGLHAALEYFPVGSGVGSFEAVYPQFENPAEVTNIYVNRAHNDYLEILIETGLAGVALILAFALWWARRSLSAWKSERPGAHWSRAGSAIITLLALHSLIDFPLRSFALLSILVLACAWLERVWTSDVSVASERDPAS